MMTIWSDLRYAFRQWRKSPWFTVIAIAALALGIGANTAIFTVFNQVLLSKLPVRKPEELVFIGEHSAAETGGIDTYGWDEDQTFTYPGYKAFRDGNHVFTGLAAAGFSGATLVTSKDATQVNMGLVSGNYFSVLEVRPVLGRLLLPSDDIEHAGNPVVVLSEDYWRSHFGSDPSVLNQVVHINKQPLTIIGVAQHRGLMDSNPFDIFIPISIERAIMTDDYDRLEDPLERWIVLFGRLSPGTTRTQVLADLSPIWRNWRREVLNTMSHRIPARMQAVWLDTHLSVRDGDRGLALLEGWLGGFLKVLEAMALTILLIACANIANLLLVKTARRYGELAVRGALGASRRRILQQVLTEGLLLGVDGALAGLILGWLSLQWVMKIIPESNPLHSALVGRMDWRILLFGSALGIFTSILFSVAPAFLSMRVNLIRALHLQSGSVAGGNGLRNGLVATEIALSMTLLVAATVFGWTLYRLRTIPLGFTSARLWTFRVDAPAIGKSDSEIRDEYRRITEAIRAFPGIASVSFAQEGLASGEHSWGHITVAGFTSRENEPDTFQDWVTPGFFSTVQIPLIAGREFTDADRLGAARVAIVDEAFVKRYFAGDVHAALAGSFQFGKGTSSSSFPSPDGSDVRIVGIIPTSRVASFNSLPSKPFFCLSYDQTYTSEPTHGHRFHQATFYLRTRGDDTSLPNAIRRLVHNIDPNLPVTGLQTMNERIGDTIFETRLMTWLSISISSLALLLVAIGLYGVLSFSVAQRTKEIGIRMALGASRENISALVVRQVGYLIGAGLMAGCGLGWLAVQLLRSEVSDLQRSPFWLLVASTMGLIAVMVVAGYLPAKRAASVEPMEALRAE